MPVREEVLDLAVGAELLARVVVVEAQVDPARPGLFDPLGREPARGGETEGRESRGCGPQRARQMRESGSKVLQANQKATYDSGMRSSRAPASGPLTATPSMSHALPVSWSR